MVWFGAVPVIVTSAGSPVSPASTVPTVSVFAGPVAPVAPVAPVGPVGPVGPMRSTYSPGHTPAAFGPYRRSFVVSM